jgi:hypothetical protein
MSDDRRPMTVAELADWCAAAVEEGHGALRIDVCVPLGDGVLRKAALNRPMVLHSGGSNYHAELLAWPFELVWPVSVPRSPEGAR